MIQSEHDDPDLSMLLAITDSPPDGAARARAAAVRRQRRRRAVASAGAVAVIAAMVWGLRAHQSPDVEHVATRRPPSVATTTTPVTPPSPTLPEPTVPSGWRTVDYGNLRLSVPLDTQIERPGSNSCPQLVVDLHLGGPGPSMSCPSPADQHRTTVRVTLGPPPDSPNRGPTINGLHTIVLADSLRLERIAVPRLGASIFLAGPQANAILRTIAPSSRWRALNQPSADQTQGWQTIAAYGLQLKAPPTWRLHRLTSNDNGPQGCSKPFPPGDGGVWLGQGAQFAASCPAPPWMPGWNAGIWMRPSDPNPQPAEQHRILQGLRVAILTSDPEQATIELQISTHGHDISVTIGVDQDPTNAAAILSSIRPT